MRRLIIASLLLACSFSAAAQTLTGTVNNETTRKPAAGAEVALVRLAQGMEELGHTKAGAQGQFTFKLPDSTSRYLVKAHFQNVDYFEQIQPGNSSVQVAVYNSAQTVPQVEIVNLSHVFETDGSTLKVIEVFNLRNTAFPKVTQAAFDFYLPDNAQISFSEARSNAGVPVKVSTAALPEKNKYQFLFPVKPGSTRYELVYSMPYGGAYKMETRYVLPPHKFYVVTPKTMKFSATGGAQFHPESWPVEPTLDMTVNTADSPTSAKSVAYEISGVGLIPQDTPQQQQQPQPGQPAQNTPGGGLGVPNEKPNPISAGQWGFLSVLALFMAAGALFIYMVSSGGDASARPARAKGGGSASLLDALKEEMFRLEADRLQDRISKQEYESAKSALDKTLQRAMKRKPARG